MFTDGELQAMLDAMVKLAESLVARNLEDDTAQDAINWADAGVSLRERLSETTQQLAQCMCFAKHGEEHVMAFLRRYAEIAVLNYRSGLTRS